MVGRADKAVAYGEDAIFAVGGERNPQCSGSAPQDDVEKLGVYLAVLKSTSELRYRRNIAWPFVHLHAIEPTQLRRQRRVDGAGRPKFDFHTGTRSPTAGP